MAIEVDLGCNVLAVEKFIELNDTPSSYIGQAGKLATVNGTEDGLEFSEVVSGGVQSVTGNKVDNTDPLNPVIEDTTKTDVGLGNCNNTSDANKPISTATQTALDDKVSSTTTGEPTGSDVILNTVSLTQAEYDAGTPIATTFYVITDA